MSYPPLDLVVCNICLFHFWPEGGRRCFDCFPEDYLDIESEA